MAMTAVCRFEGTRGRDVGGGVDASAAPLMPPPPRMSFVSPEGLEVPLRREEGRGGDLGPVGGVPLGDFDTGEGAGDGDELRGGSRVVAISAANEAASASRVGAATEGSADATLELRCRCVGTVAPETGADAVAALGVWSCDTDAVRPWRPPSAARGVTAATTLLTQPPKKLACGRMARGTACTGAPHSATDADSAATDPGGVVAPDSEDVTSTLPKPVEAEVMPTAEAMPDSDTDCTAVVGCCGAVTCGDASAGGALRWREPRDSGRTLLGMGVAPEACANAVAARAAATA